MRIPNVFPVLLLILALAKCSQSSSTNVTAIVTPSFPIREARVSFETVTKISEINNLGSKSQDQDCGITSISNNKKEGFLARIKRMAMKLKARFRGSSKTLTASYGSSVTTSLSSDNTANYDDLKIQEYSGEDISTTSLTSVTNCKRLLSFNMSTKGKKKRKSISKISSTDEPAGLPFFTPESSLVPKSVSVPSSITNLATSNTLQLLVECFSNTFESLPSQSQSFTLKDIPSPTITASSSISTSPISPVNVLTSTSSTYPILSEITSASVIMNDFVPPAKSQSYASVSSSIQSIQTNEKCPGTVCSRGEFIGNKSRDSLADLETFKVHSPNVYALIEHRMQMARAAREHMLNMKHRMAAVLRLYQKRAIEESRDKTHQHTLNQLLNNVEEKLNSPECQDNEACNECRKTAAQLVTVTRNLAQRVRIRSRIFRQRMAKWAKRSFIERNALFQQLRLAQERDAVGNKRIHELQYWYLRRIHALDTASREKFSSLVKALQAHEANLQKTLDTRLDLLYKKVGHIVAESNSSDHLQRVINGQAAIGKIASSTDAKISHLSQNLIEKLNKTAIHTEDLEKIARQIDQLTSLIKERNVNPQMQAESVSLRQEISHLTQAVLESLKKGMKSSNANLKSTNSVNQPHSLHIDSHLHNLEARQDEIQLKLAQLLATIKAHDLSTTGSLNKEIKAAQKSTSKMVNLAAKVSMEHVSEELRRHSASMHKLLQETSQKHDTEHHKEHLELQHSMDETKEMIAKVSSISARILDSERKVHEQDHTMINKPHEEQVLLARLVLALTEVVNKRIYPMTARLLENGHQLIDRVKSLESKIDKQSLLSNKILDDSNRFRENFSKLNTPATVTIVKTQVAPPVSKIQEVSLASDRLTKTSIIRETITVTKSLEKPCSSIKSTENISLTTASGTATSMNVQDSASTTKFEEKVSCPTVRQTASNFNAQKEISKFKLQQSDSKYKKLEESNQIQEDKVQSFGQSINSSSTIENVSHPRNSMVEENPKVLVYHKPSNITKIMHDKIISQKCMHLNESKYGAAEPLTIKRVIRKVCSKSEPEYRETNMLVNHVESAEERESIIKAQKLAKRRAFFEKRRRQIYRKPKQSNCKMVIHNEIQGSTTAKSLINKKIGECMIKKISKNAQLGSQINAIREEHELRVKKASEGEALTPEPLF